MIQMAFSNLMTYWQIEDDLKKLNKQILGGYHEFHELKEDIRYFINLYKGEMFNRLIRIVNHSDEQKVIKEKERWYYDITDMLELAKYSEEPSFIKNRHIIDSFIKSIEENNTYSTLDNTISSYSYKKRLYILSYARDRIGRVNVDSKIVQKHILDLQEAVDYLDSQVFKKEQTEYKKKMCEKLLSLLRCEKVLSLLNSEYNNTILINELIEKAKRKNDEFEASMNHAENKYMEIR